MNIVYNASAGTGKTYQVTNLYTELVMAQGIDPRDILLMTFTDNAAEELRIRVTQRLIKARRNTDDETAARAADALYRLPSASICTIHAFCTRLLREHALEAGLSPAFTVFESEARDELLEQITRDELLNRLESDSDFKSFCAGAHIIGYGQGFGSSITETVPNLISQAGSLGISLENAEAMLPEPQAVGSLPAFEAIFQRLEELPKRTADAQQVFQCLEDNLPKAGNVEKLVKILLDSGLKKFGRGKGQKPISDDFWDLVNAVDGAVKYRERHPAAKAFARYVQAVVQEFQRRKHEMDCVDFDDLLLMGHRLLKDGGAEPEFKYVIVDEVQDTSRIQCDLIQCLWGENTRLVICGDKKQSIYTWRGADPQVMPDLEKLIMQREDHDIRSLQTSYRSKGPILDAVNSIFAHVYDSGAYGETDCLTVNKAFHTKDEKPCVEFLAADDEGEDERSKQEKVAAETQAVAERIQLLVKGSNDWKPAFRYSEESLKFLPLAGRNEFRYADILILLRRTSHQEALEHALRQAGVPYTVGGKGRGLFTRQETRDVSLFLNVLADPADVLSLIGFLRSPWIGLSDEAIAQLAWSKERFSGDNLLEYFSGRADRKVCSTCAADFPVCPTEAAKVEFAQQSIWTYRKLMGTKLVSELVRRFIAETGYDAMLAGLSRGTQRLANLRKVIDWLRENERGGRVVPATAARRLKERIENPPPVPQAALLDPEQNAVTIMTVHGAKGLTKRVVFLPDVSFRPDSDRAFTSVFFDKTHAPTLGLKITAPDRGAAESPGFKSARARAREVRDHELKNLFYVALTRARDLVVVSASPGKRPEGWLKELEPFIADGTLLSRSYSKIAASAKDQQVCSTHDATAVPKVGTFALPALPVKSRVQRIPATRLAKQTDRLVEIPDQWDSEADVTTIGHTESAAALGSLGHAALEQLALNQWRGSAREWVDVLRAEFDVGETAGDEIAQRVSKTVPLMTEKTAQMDELIPEFPFVMKTQQNEAMLIIDGTIDLLCRQGSRFTVYDYKFTEESDQHVVETYAGQMKIYRQAVERASPQAESIEINLIIISKTGVRELPMPI